VPVEVAPWLRPGAPEGVSRLVEGPPASRPEARGAGGAFAVAPVSGGGAVLAADPAGPSVSAVLHPASAITTSKVVVDSLQSMRRTFVADPR
jgi:hypothetical protein